MRVLSYKNDGGGGQAGVGEGGDEDEEHGKADDKAHDELSTLRFNYHRTAFDIDLDELEEHSWRLPHTDVSDYFNFGFNEPTWRVCAHLHACLSLLF
jgi:hypothetical protein